MEPAHLLYPYINKFLRKYTFIIFHFSFEISAADVHVIFLLNMIVK